MNEQYIIDDNEAKIFKVNRKVFVDPKILEEEFEKIFNKCWIYVGHVSEVKKPNDFVTREVAGRPVIFARDMTGKVNAFLNTCSHRGATVCREHKGSSKTFRCFYHAWTFTNDGKLNSLPGEDAYGPNFSKDHMGLRHVPRLEEYRGFYFVNFDKNAESLYDYLAGAKEYLDLIADTAPTEMEIIQGTQEYDMRANWKLLVENSFDDYHVVPTHITYLEYLKKSGVDVHLPKGLLMPAHGIGKSLGNGHAVIDNETYRGRPVANWMPIYGEEAKEEINEIRKELVDRLGEERARRIAQTNRNLVIFPNLVINDGSSITVRTFFPKSHDNMRVTAWALGVEGESESARARRLDSFLTFYGPGGFATPDDTEALEVAQEGYKAWQELGWSDVSRGMNKEGEQLNTDEIHLRTFWRRWNEIMTGKVQLEEVK
ncbi:aromatic ring-hydroxylating oxygenase subunit alpha [Bacillus sp. Marseille-P3661]|uniref:aromatic ring-hydroxylating oxygenase subunit alpha n=1 Tax=Bacillus sp. Marseille-P3661 TaxID=1936234 RepID=UPI000C84B6E9|nr:aromatic ring-hydroxylating dioxygenase subunit alpha [Bacillus sp. Marseille-P3661]